MHFFVQYPLKLSLLETKYNHNVYAANYRATPHSSDPTGPGYGYGCGYGGNTVKGAKKPLCK